MANANIIDALLELQSAGVDLSPLKGKLPGAAAALVGKQFQARSSMDRAKLMSDLGINEAEAKAVLESTLLDQKHRQTLEVDKATGLRQADLKILANNLEMAKTQQEVDLAIEKMREAAALRNKESVELGLLYDQAKPLAKGSLSKTNELDLLLTQMKKYTGGDTMAEGIEEMIRRNRDLATENKLDEVKKLMKAGGVDLPDEEGMRKVINSRLERDRSNNFTVADVMQEQRMAALDARAKEKAAEDLRKKLEQTEPGRKSVFRYATAEERQRRLEAGEPVDKIQAENRKTGRLRGIVGGTLAGAVAAGLAAKIFGSNNETPKLPPEVQMALMQQMQRSGGGGTDPALSEGRELLNTSRTLGIIKQMQEMAAQAASAATPPVYRLV